LKLHEMSVISFSAILLAAFTGSVHCVGMCGGFVAVLSGHKIDKNTSFGGKLFSILYTIADVLVRMRFWARFLDFWDRSSLCPLKRRDCCGLRLGVL
jgi:hypothetical protein